jgi:hypothetical protein
VRKRKYDRLKRSVQAPNRSQWVLTETTDKNSLPKAIDYPHAGKSAGDIELEISVD